MVEIASGWVACVDRGPDWLFVKLHNAEQITAESIPLADNLWQMLREHFVGRLVLELDEVDFRSHLLAQLLALHRRIDHHGGVLRLCGVSDENQQVLRASRLDGRFPQFRSREEAVYGHRPTRPR